MLEPSFGVRPLLLRTVERQRTSLKQLVNSPRILNLEVALERIGGDVKLFRDVFQLFLTEAQAQLDRVDTHVKSQDAAAIITLAHGMHSAARSVGAEQIASSWKALEQAAKLGEWHRISPDGLLRIIAEQTQELIAIARSEGLP